MNQIIILAGGKGTRMESDIPKALHPVKGILIIKRVLKNIKPLFPRPVIVVGYKGEEIKSALGEDSFDYVYQAEQKGMGHAVLCTKEALQNKDYKNILVLPGDHPLISASTLEKLIAIHEQKQAKCSLATVSVPNFEGDFKSFYNCGRIVRDENGEMKKIIEFKDTTKEEKDIREVNVCYHCFDAHWLWENLDKLKNNNKAGEYYLTDIVRIASENDAKMASFIVDNAFEGLGINNAEQLEIAESYC